MTLEEKIKQVEEFRPIDDVFFEVFADDTAVCEEILRIILEDAKLKVIDVIVQSSKKNIYGRSVRLDALCVTGNGNRVNIEVQRSDNDNHLKRARFNAASITLKDSDTGDRFDDIVDVCIVYISQFDIFKWGKTIYHIDKTVRETGTVIDDGETEVFVNTAINDGSDISELMQCFTQKEIDNVKFPKMSERIKYLKKTEGGVNSVCEVMEKYQQKAVDEANVVAVFNMLSLGVEENAILKLYPEQFDAGKKRFLESQKLI